MMSLGVVDLFRNLQIKCTFGLPDMAITTIIEADSPIQYWRKIKETWQYRNLLSMLSYRDIRVRYAQTLLGMAWAIINPLLSVLLLYFVFGVVVKVDTQGVPPCRWRSRGVRHWRTIAGKKNLLPPADHSIVKIYCGIH